MDKEKVLSLAKLARVKIGEAEAETLSHEFEAILNYVGEIKEVATGSSQPTANHFALRNVMREDGQGHEPALFSEKILAQAPAREGNYLKVKKIL